MLFFVTRELRVLLDAPDGVEGSEWWAVIAADADDAIATIENAITEYVPTPKTKIERVMDYIRADEVIEEKAYGGGLSSSEVFLETAVVAYLTGLI
jgi:translation elongation factor EF-Tu-like GTPase